MSQQPRFFQKNYLDINSSNAEEISVSDTVASNRGQGLVNLMRNRNNTSGWITTGSNDAAQTELRVNLSRAKSLRSIVLVGHNFKEYTIKYSNNTPEYKQFNSPIHVTSNTKETTAHFFDPTLLTSIKITILGTQIPNSDKRMSQLIITNPIKSGQLVGWPEFQNPTLYLRKKKKETLSGKIHLSQNAGSYKTKLLFRSWPESQDIELLRSLFFHQKSGFLFWPCGGDEEQFSYNIDGFRLKDIYFCKITSEWNPSWNKALYKSGINLTVDIEESI